MEERIEEGAGISTSSGGSGRGGWCGIGSGGSHRLVFFVVEIVGVAELFEILNSKNYLAMTNLYLYCWNGILLFDMRGRCYRTMTSAAMVEREREMSWACVEEFASEFKEIDDIQTMTWQKLEHLSSVRVQHATWINESTGASRCLASLACSCYVNVCRY